MLSQLHPPHHARIDTAWRIVIPAECRSSFSARPGDTVVIESDATDSLRVRTLEQVIQEVQAAFAPYKREGESVVDELIAERRAEAARE